MSSLQIAAGRLMFKHLIFHPNTNFFALYFLFNTLTFFAFNQIIFYSFFLFLLRRKKEVIFWQLCYKQNWQTTWPKVLKFLTYSSFSSSDFWCEITFSLCLTTMLQEFKIIIKEKKERSPKKIPSSGIVVKVRSTLARFRPSTVFFATHSFFLHFFAHP